MPLALFGITNDGLNLFVNLVVLFLVVVWIALIVWTYLDARRRLNDPVLIVAATVASFFPFVGTIVYSILRPPEFIDDARERELEIRASELRVRQLEEQSCPSCGFPIERTYLRCPSCRSRVKDPCESCGKPIDPRWNVCPYCEAPVRRAAALPARRGSARPARKAPTGTPRRRKPADAKAADGAKAPAASRRSAEATRAKKPPTRSSSSARSSSATRSPQRAKPKPQASGSSAASNSGATQESDAAKPAAPAEGEESARPATK